eukprot:scaffold291162_cov20-Prasinocladus_malaysianus.AAC.1
MTTRFETNPNPSHQWVRNESKPKSEGFETNLNYRIRDVFEILVQLIRDSNLALPCLPAARTSESGHSTSPIDNK